MWRGRGKTSLALSWMFGALFCCFQILDKLHRDACPYPIWLLTATRWW